jgi:two-component system cell cycle sensor histidine kinase/response regulator CckA
LAETIAADRKPGKLAAIPPMANATRPSSAFSAQVVTGVILLIGVFGSVWAFYDARDRELQRAETEFIRRAAILHSLTREIIGRYESAVFDLRAMFALEGGVTRADFTQATRNLAERNPGVKAFEWVPVISATDRAAVESALSQDQGRPVEFTERDATGRLVRAAVRPEYYPIIYAEPVAGNERALGFDLKVGPTLGALKRARQTQQMSLSGQIRLVQENQEQRGVVMIWPVYHAAPDAGEAGGPVIFRGFVQAVFRVQDMLESTRTRSWPWRMQCSCARS